MIWNIIANNGIITEFGYNPPPSTPVNASLIITFTILLFLIITASSVIILGYFSQKSSEKNDKNKHEQYKQSLESLDRQLSDGKISEITYREMKEDLEERYKKKWWET